MGRRGGRGALLAVFALAGLTAACDDAGPASPFDDEALLAEEDALALALLNDDLATEAALAMAEVSGPAAMRGGMGPMHRQAAEGLAAEARLRFQEARAALADGDQTRAAERAREARRLVAQAMVEAGGARALRGAAERMEHLEDWVRGEMGAYEDAAGLLGELARLRETARRRMQEGNFLDAAAAGVLAEQRHRFRHRWQQMDPADRVERAELMVGLAGEAVALAARILEGAGGADAEQARFLALAEEELAQAVAALEGDAPWRAVHLAHLAQWSALKAVVLPGG
ncbi:MAG: hypothetical protein RQ751_13135, partial [Longimicrobiales bacterium]|nr:hypothetical protein [Longimicrobiales bacterium]